MYVQKKFGNALLDNQPSPGVASLLAESERAVREGKHQQAYRLAVEATQLAPENIEAWLLRATLAPSLNERIICVNHLNELAPDFQDRYSVAFFALKELLDQNPFLAYLEETDKLYRVINADRVILSIPKRRAPLDSPPPDEAPPGPLRGAYRWLIISFLGLLTAGLATMLFAPLAALAALRVQQSAESPPERVRSAVVLLAASALFIIGAVFSILFLLHWAG